VIAPWLPFFQGRQSVSRLTVTLSGVVTEQQTRHISLNVTTTFAAKINRFHIGLRRFRCTGVVFRAISGEQAPLETDTFEKALPDNCYGIRTRVTTCRKINIRYDRLIAALTSACYHDEIVSDLLANLALYKYLLIHRSHQPPHWRSLNFVYLGPGYTLLIFKPMPEYNLLPQLL